MNKRIKRLTRMYHKLFVCALCILFLFSSSCRVNKNETIGLKADTQKAPKVKRGSFIKNILYGYSEVDDNIIDPDNDTEYDFELEYEEIYD